MQQLDEIFKILTTLFTQKLEPGKLPALSGDLTTVQKPFLAAIACFAVAACQQIGTPHDVAGNFIVHAENDSYVWNWTMENAFGKECSAIDAVPTQNSYREFGEGFQVVVKSSDGKILGTGLIGKGAIANLSSFGTCKVPFSVKGLPNADFYEFTVGSKKGAIVSRQQLETNNWQINLAAMPDSLQINTESQPSEADLKQWEATRAMELKSQIEQEKASELSEKAEAKYNKTQTCIAEKELQDQWNGKPISEECKKLLQDDKN